MGIDCWSYYVVNYVVNYVVEYQAHGKDVKVHGDVIDRKVNRMEMGHEGPVDFDRDADAQGVGMTEEG